MDVAILTVGDELLSGDTENTNASWLARQVTERGGSVVRMLTVPDDVDLIVETVREWSAAFDAVVVTGGLGGTHDDVTMDAIAAGFDRELVVDPAVRDDVVRTAAAFRDDNPDLVDRYELDLDVDTWSSMPADARPLLNPVGLSPGCVVENVYVLPGVPSEMRAMFDTVADEFGGDAVSESLYTPAPESALVAPLEELRGRFDVAVGSYPNVGEPLNRVRVVGTDADTVAEAAAWLRTRIDVVEADEGESEGDDAGN